MLLKLERFNREWIGGEVSKFYSVKSFSYMYGPGLMLLDYNLGILYLLAMSSLATYGILLAGYSSINIYNKTVRISNYANIYKYFYLYILVIRCVVLLYVLLFFLSSFNFFAKDLYFELGSIDIYCYESLLCVIIFHKVKANIYVKNPQLRNIHNTKSLCSIKGTEGLDSIKSLHSSFIKELYKDRNASVKPFDREFILDTCYNCLDKSIKSEFLKRWGTKPCIYLIEYKYDPLVYYIGRTTLFKRRFHNHLKAESGSKLHLFLNLVGWEHFYISIIEECTPDKQGLRENYYLQKYLPLLNSVFSSSITEVAINVTLKKKLEDLSSNHCLPSTKNIPLYVYNIDDKGISKEFVLFNSMKETSTTLGINMASINQYRNTSVPYRGRLFYTDPIKNFNQAFELSKKNTPKGLVNRVVPTKLWCYDAKTLELEKGSPFFSKTQASKSLGIGRGVIDYFLDTGKPEGVTGRYLYSIPLTEEEIKNLLLASENLQLGIKIQVWAYKAKTFELINNSPFPSVKDAANYFNVNYRTITRHLDTKLATTQNKLLVYLFKKEVDLKLIADLKKDELGVARYMRTEIWVYKVDTEGKLSLISNKPFRTKREVIREIGIHVTVLNKYLDTYQVYRDMLFYTYPCHT